MAALKHKLAYQLLISLAQVMLPLCTYPYITRVLGPETIGAVNYADFVSQVFISVAALGIPLYAIRETAMRRNNAPARATLVKELMVIHTILSLLAAISFLLLMRHKLQQHTTLYLLAATNILISAVAFNWYTQGMEYFRFAAIRDIAIKSAMLLCFYLLVRHESDGALFFGIFTAGLFATAFINSWKAFSENNPARGSIHIKKHLSPLLHFFLLSSAISIYEYFDTIILDYITHNASEVGYYTTVLKLVRIVTAIVIMAGTVMLPHVSFLLSQGNNDQAKQYLNKFFQLIIAAGIPASAGIFIFAKEIIQAVAGDRFLPAIPLLRALGFLPLVIGVSNLFCYQVLVPFRKERVFLLTALIACASSIIFNFLLIPHFQAMGAAWATLITEIVVTVFSGCMAYRFIRLAIPYVATAQTIIASFFFYPAAVLCRSVFQTPLGILAAGILLCLLIYTVLQYFVFKNTAVKEMLAFAAKLPAGKRSTGR